VPTDRQRIAQLEREVAAQSEMWSLLGAALRRITQLERDIEKLQRPSERPTARPGAYSIVAPKDKK
jgi:hypothetical protein